MGKIFLVVGGIVAGIVFLYYLFSSDSDKSAKGFLGGILGSATMGATAGAGCLAFIGYAIIALLPFILIILLIRSCC